MNSQQMQEEFLHVFHRFRQFQYNQMVCGLTKGEFLVLSMIQDYLSRNPSSKGMYVSELARQMRVTSPAISRTLRTLDGRGLIERTVDRDDRRTTYIILTAAGEQARQAAAEQMRVFLDRVMARMGEEDMVALMALWNRLADIMSDELAKETEHAQTN